jgi:hypothetical protein
MEHSDQILVLPTGVVTKTDVARLRREVEALDSVLRQTAIRQPGTAIKLPRTSRLLDELVAVNKLNVLHEADRDRLTSYLMTVHTKAPVLHMSFSADASPLFSQRLVAWLRQELHPMVLLQIGLQPTIGAGAVVRTTNKYFDFSLREHFAHQKGLLIQKLIGDSNG